jgi:heavy metal translocating P-type ATPase
MRIFEHTQSPLPTFKCVHCDELSSVALYDEQDAKKENPFCCHGCLTVYHVLKSKGLEEYYSIKAQAGIIKRRSPVELEKTRYLYMDEPEFLKEFSYQNVQKNSQMEFYLEGIHCLACLWLIEKLPMIVPGVLSSKLDMEKSIVTVTIDQTGKFSQVAYELNTLGYRPHVLKKNQETHEFKIQEERAFLLRMGVAAAGASNIMLYAVSLYGGASDVYAKIFNFLTVVFAFPVLTYSAFPFYKNAWVSLKNKNLSIDVPISLSLILGGVMGVYNLILGVHENYFDSLTTLVFLLLISRYFLRKIQEKALSTSDLHYFYQGESVQRLKNSNNNNNEVLEDIHPKYIKVGDILKISSGDFIPADGKIIRGKSYVNMALLTGESTPVAVCSQDKIYAGTQNISEDLFMEVEKLQKNSRLGEILKGVEQGWFKRAPIVDLTDKVSKYFILSVFILSASLFIYLLLTQNFKHALEHALTLMIVTCPCALALSVPLTFTRALNQAADHGMIIKNEAVLQKLSEIKNILIDKTGTLTLGKQKVVNFVLHQKLQSSLSVYEVIYNLEKISKHPVAKSLLEFVSLHPVQDYKVEDYLETPGVGVEAKIQGSHFKINRKGIWENEELVATFELTDQVRADAKRSLLQLKNMGQSATILSGDKKEKVKKMITDLGCGELTYQAELTPEQKSTLVSQTDHAMMIGDGANDAIAFSHAHVGVAVHGSVDMALRSADVYLVTPGLTAIKRLLILGQETMKVIKRNLVLSLLYNATSVVLVFMGYITPLIAAIIMPLSSLTVFFSSILGTKKLRMLWK